MEEIKVFCLKPLEGYANVEVIDREDYKAFLRLLNCDIFDVVSRSIGGVEFDIYCDDLGLFAPEVAVSLVDESKDENYNIVGNIVIAHHDVEGETTGVSEDEIDLILNHLYNAIQNEKHTLVILG